VWAQEDFEKFHKAYPDGPLRDLLDLLQWTGARLGEITGLRAQDVKLKAAVPHLVIEPHEARELKNEESACRVPLHPQVIEAAQRVAAGGLQGVTKDAWSKRLNRARQQLGIPHDIHTFRHGFKRAWRACGLPIDQANAIQGHADHSVSGTYGNAQGYPLRPLARPSQA
jgi:integrase